MGRWRSPSLAVSKPSTESGGQCPPPQPPLPKGGSYMFSLAVRECARLKLTRMPAVLSSFDARFSDGVRIEAGISDSPGGATVNSQGCKPLETRDVNNPSLSGIAFSAPQGLRRRGELWNLPVSQGFAPLAIHGRPSGAAGNNNPNSLQLSPTPGISRFDTTAYQKSATSKLPNGG